MKTTLSIAVAFVCISLSANAKDQNVNKVARLVEAGQYQQALLSISKTKRIGIQLTKLKAVSYLELEQYAKAELVYLDLKLLDDGVDVNNNLGLVYLRQARYAEAVALFRDTIRRFPSDSAAFKNLGDFYVYLAQATYAKGVESVTENDDLQTNLDRVGAFFIKKPNVISSTEVASSANTKWRFRKGMSIVEHELDEGELVSKSQ
jgi:tetratricopeptide (TPR) repeat protein